MTTDNPQAFPTAVSADSGGCLNHGKPGMTLRDWFAGQALAGWLASSEHPEPAAKSAYEYADAMLAARVVESAPSPVVRM